MESFSVKKKKNWRNEIERIESKSPQCTNCLPIFFQDGRISIDFSRWRWYKESKVLHNLVDPWLRARATVSSFPGGLQDTAQLHRRKTGLSHRLLFCRRDSPSLFHRLPRATTRDGHSADPLDNGGAEVSTTPRGRRTTIIIPDNPKRQSLLPKQHWKEYRKEYRNCFLSEPTPNRLWTELSLSLSLSIEFLCLSSWKR